MADHKSDPASRARLSAFLEFAPEAIFIKDANGRYVEVSRVFLTLAGKTAAEVIGRCDADLFDPDTTAKFQAEDDEVRRTDRPILFEEEFAYAGRQLAFLTQKFPLPGGEVAGIATNITDRKRAEEELRSVADRLAVAIEGTGIGPYELNLSTGEGIWSEAAFEMLGLSPPLDCRGTYAIWRSSIHPEDLERVEHDHNEAARRGGSWQSEYRIIRPDNGEVRWLYAYGRFTERGGTVYSTGIAFDDTDRKLAELALAESEARLRALTDNLPGGMVYQLVTGAAPTDRKFLYVSQSLEALTGFRAEDALRDPMVAYGLIVPEDRERVAKAEARAISELSVFDCEVRFRRRDGMLRWGRIISAPRRQADGTLVWDGIKVDITDQKEAEQQLRDLNANLEKRAAERAAELAAAEEALRQAQKLESMGQLTGGVAHDFNNLLSPIIGGLDMLLRRGVSDERSKRTLEGALASAERARTLVQRLLAFARRQPLQPRPVDLEQLISGMVPLLESTVGPRIELRVDVPQGLRPAHADDNQLEMGLLNLALNARDAMPDGGTLTLSARAVQNGDALVIRVADTGCGMDEQVCRRAIEPFFSTKGVGQGTGLGLSMVHGLAHQLGGMLSIESAPEQGTTIELMLPATDVAHEEVAGSAVSSQLHTGMAILVDDEDLVRESTADMLSDLGFEVVQCASGQDALTRLAHGLVPSVLITDHLMPAMTGSQLIGEAHKLHPRLPVLLVSGYADSHGVAADVQRLTKPFRRAELEEALNTVLTGS